MGIWSKEYHEGYQQGYKDAKEEYKKYESDYNYVDINKDGKFFGKD